MRGSLCRACEIVEMSDIARRLLAHRPALILDAPGLACVFEPGLYSFREHGQVRRRAVWPCACLASLPEGGVVCTASSLATLL
ncbi:hypothetical protein MTO96_011590 [Rhipicephalus appendiculatus]